MKTCSVFFMAVALLTAVSCSRPSGEIREGLRPGSSAQSSPDETSQTGVEVIFNGGYVTDTRDHGRPVALIAAALGVKPEVFRQAFSGVTPAKGGGPTRAQAHANKKVLIDALGKYGVTNERLDAVSDYYRYNRRAGEVWKRTPAKATAIINDGKVSGFSISNPGAGYTTVPTVSVPGYDDLQVRAKIEFTEEFTTNGRVTELTIVVD